MAAQRYNSDVRILIEEAAGHPEHAHQEIELDYVLSGSLTVRIAGEAYRMGEGDILLINSGKLHTWQDAEQCLLCRIMLNYSSVCKTLGKYHICFWCNSVSTGYHDTDSLRLVLNLLIREFHVAESQESFAVKALKYRVLDVLVKEYLLPGNEPWSEVEDERIREILEQVNVSYADRISLTEIARGMYLSDSYLSRVFKSAVGVSFQEYLNRARLEHGVESLLYTTKSVAEISEECGFANPSAFNKLFKKTYGCAPTEYKKSLTGRTVPTETGDAIREDAGAKLESWLRLMEGASSEEVEIVETVTVPAAAKRSFQKNTIRCLNCGTVYDFIYATTREQFLTLHNELGVPYVRLTGILNPDLHLRADDGSGLYHFGLVDSVFDFLVAHGITPVLDLLNWRKKYDLDYGAPLFIDELRGLPFRDLGDWQKLLRDMVAHFAQRYGTECVSHWVFEIGEDNDYQACCRQMGREEIPYTRLWDAGFDAVKEVCPEFRLSASSSVLQEEFCGRAPDFILLNVFPYRSSRAEEDVYASRITDLDFVETAVRKERRKLTRLGFGGIPLMLAQWGTSVSERNYYNDTCAKAAHVLYHLLALEGENCVMSYYHSLDFLSQYMDSDAPLVGGCGLMSTDGICKPIYYAFYFMNKMHGQILEKGETHVAMRNRDGHYYLLVFHVKNFGHSYYLHKESQTRLEELATMYEDDRRKKFVFTFQGVPEGTYQVKSRTLVEREGSALYEWKEMGYPQRLKPSEIDYLHGVSGPRIRAAKEQARSGLLTVEVTLNPHQIVLFHIIRSD